MKIARYSACAVAALAVALPGPPSARATETTRPEYVAAVEPICKVNTKANERILDGVKAEVKKNELKPAAAKFFKASGALKQTLVELRAEPRPAADRARLAKWLGYVKREVELFRLAAKRLEVGDRVGAQGMALRLTNNATLANNTVLGFEFHYCRFEPSRFT